MIAYVLLTLALAAESEAAANYTVPDPAPYITPENLAEMERDKVVVLKRDTKSEGDGVAGSGLAMALIKAPTDAVWGHLTDFEKQPEFMPRILTAEEYSKDGNKTGIKQTVKIAWKTIDYHIIQTTDDAQYLMRWELDHSKENDIAETVGSWQLVPHNDDQTIAVYSLNVDSGMRVPKFIENFLMTRDLPGLIEALKLRSESGGEYVK